jgi:hypothetical protein
MSRNYVYDNSDFKWVPMTQPGTSTSGPSGGGDASAANQIAGNASLTSIGSKVATEATLAAQAARFGALAEAAPATDTASAGLNGRLQRIAQRLTSLIALLPAGLGAKTSAASLSTTPASDAAYVGKPFTPVVVATVSETVAHACSTTALTAVACTSGEALRFGNPGSLAIGFMFGPAAVASTITYATAMDIMPGSVEVFTVPPGVTHYSAIMPSGTGTLKRTRGAGA